MSKKPDYTFKVLNIVSWILFIGVCIEAAGFIFNAFVTLLFNPAGAGRFWIGVDLSELYNYNQRHYITIISLMIIVAVMKALMFYLIVKIFYNKKLNLSQPFSESVRRFISNVAYLALGIGLISFLGTKFSEEIVTQGVSVPAIQYLRLGGADVWLFMGVTLLIIAHIFKRAIEIQNENDLTV